MFHLHLWLCLSSIDSVPSHPTRTIKYQCSPCSTTIDIITWDVDSDHDWGTGHFTICVSFIFSGAANYVCQGVIFKPATSPLGNG